MEKQVDKWIDGLVDEYTGGWKSGWVDGGVLGCYRRTPDEEDRKLLLQCILRNFTIVKPKKIRK